MKYNDFTFDALIEYNPTKISLAVKKNNETISQYQVEPKLWAEGPLQLFVPTENMFGLVLESLGIVEVYKFDITTNDFQELWNPEFNAGVYIVYVDWENEVIFTENTNTDKPLPKNFKYQIQMFNNRKHEAKIIASSIGSRIEILNKENGRIEYKEIKDGIDKVSVFLY